MCSTGVFAAGLLVLAHGVGLAWQPESSAAAGFSKSPGVACASSVRLAERTRYYDFFGARLTDANQDLRARLLTANDHSGRVQQFAGQADWSIEWQTCLEQQSGLCRIAGVELTVNVTYTLPRWADRDWSTRELRARWDRYAQSLAAHEKGHGQIAYQVARNVEDDLVGLSAETCAELDAAATSRVAGWMRQGEALQNQYDRVTQHGVAQGAAYPFP